MTLTKQVRKQPVMYQLTFRRPYLQHKEKLTLITCQHRAWMDTAGVAMWAELLMGPYVQKNCGGKGLIVWDNCSCHNVPALKAIFDSVGLLVRNLPPNMTDVLQVMDIVVNAPLKAGIRRVRCGALYDYFQSWKIKRLQELVKPEQHRQLPAWAPPKPSVADGVRTVIEVENTTLATPEFRKSMVQCFIKVGLRVDPHTKLFRKFKDVKRGHHQPAARPGREDAG